MSRRQYSRICSLVHNSVHPLTAKSTASITKEQEKSLLIILSQVLNEIKIWIGDYDSNSDSDTGGDDHGNTVVDPSGKIESTLQSSPCHSSSSQCLLSTINDLVFLLGIENRFAQHLAGNVLVTISEFMLASEINWDQFIQSLCSSFNLAIRKIVSPIGINPSSSIFDSQPVSNNPSWRSICGIILVLRNVLKQRNHELDAKNLEIYLNALLSCLRNIQWDSCEDDFVDKFEFCGHLVQLFCSVVSSISSPEAMTDSLDKHSIIQEILNIFPKILTWCLGNEDRGKNTRISQYIRHKILVLMMRLSSLVDLDCKIVVSWLNLIDKYFQDLLFESITHLEARKDDCLKDSPFMPFFRNLKYNGTSNRHLQRRVVFVYLKCSFRLLGLQERQINQCSCGDSNSYSKNGFPAIYEWLQRHLPADILVNPEFYSDRCKSFTKSFLQLYIYEDDMLFEFLLQLTHMPITEESTSQAAEKNVHRLLSDIFDPINLFHLFLSELCYDHQVVLDYLISKDTGASCAEYLLRCLRIVCDKWNSFLGFSFVREFGNEFSCKRRKVMNESCMDVISLKKTCKQPFRDAANCLVLLKKSIENLHWKDLFPYNPQVLLRRLTRFHELCLTL